MLAAVYCRVSTEKDDQINSLESQKNYFFRYIQSCPDLSLFQIYADRGISGTAVKNRARFIQMMEDAEKGMFQVIITKEVSRFSRNILDAVSYSRKLRNLGVTIRFVSDGIDTSQPDAELRLSIMASLAQEESRKTSDRVKWGQTRRMEAGVVFGTSMLGYNVKNGKISINAEGAETVKMIYEKYVYFHMSAAKIAESLENEGIKTFNNNEKWSPSVIMKILKNEKYCGDLIQKKTYTPDYLTHKKKANKEKDKMIFIENHHQGIISRKLWEAAQKEINRRNPHNNRSPGKGTKFPFSGKIVCGECGMTFVSRKRKNKKGAYTVWKCPSSAGKNKCAAAYQIKNELILDMTRHSCSILLKNIKNLPERVAAIIKKADKSLENTSAQKSELLKKNIDGLSRKKFALIDTYISGKIAEQDFNALILKYEASIKQYENAFAKTETTENQNPDKFISIINYVYKLLYYKNIPDSIIAGCIENILAYKDGIIRIKFLHYPQIFEYKIQTRNTSKYNIKTQKEHP